MSSQLITHSQDLQRLIAEGFDIEIKSGNYLLVHHVPYLNSHAELKYGSLVTDLEIAGDSTTRPTQHVAYFTGEHPCDLAGIPIAKLKHESATKDLAEGVTVNH